MSANRPLPAVCSLTVLAIVLAGCPEADEPEDPCGPNGGDEVGEGCDETGEVGPLGPHECIDQENPNLDGYRVQCEGEFHSKIDFHVLGKNCEDVVGGDFCSQVYPFGPPHDDYEAPDVMACCGEGWDPVAYLDVYRDSCMQDLASQACASIAKRMEQAIEAGDFDTKKGDFTKKATNLQEYIEGHLDECAAALYEGDTNPEPGELVSHWGIPNKNGLEGWWPAKDIVVSVEAGTSVVDVHRPEENTDWLECHGPRDNDDEIFEDQTSPDGDVLVGVDLDASVGGKLVGPVIDGSRITSSMTFDTNCVDQGCPNASWSYDSGSDPSFTMEEFELYATNFDLIGGTSSLTIERARVELWRQALGTKIFDANGGSLGYEVPAGQAWFYVAGLANGVYGRFMAVNSTDIEITVDHGFWVIGPFDIESIDGADRTWTLSLDGSGWQR